jgi:formate dehydrogenase major subunit
MVTARLQPLQVLGRTVHQIVLPIHFGYAGEVTGSSNNELTSIVSDPNVSMHEAKAFTCQIRKGRLAQPSDRPSTAVAPRAQQGPMSGTPPDAQPDGRFA